MASRSAVAALVLASLVAAAAAGEAPNEAPAANVNETMSNAVYTNESFNAASVEVTYSAHKDGRSVPKNVSLGAAEKHSTMLSSDVKSIGASCVPTSNDFFGPGSGCADTEACCPTTNTCFDRSKGCAAFAARCPPPECGRDLNFKSAECPADVTRLFKRGGVLCEVSGDTTCYANSTLLALRCGATSGAARAAAAAPITAALAAAVFALLMI